MGFLNTDFGFKYLDDFHNNRIPKGLGIGNKDVDQFVSFKQGQYNIVIGVDNVGKTDFLLWYFLLLALKHDKKIDVWSGENKPEQQKRKLIQMYAGRYLQDLTYKEWQKAKLVIENHFQWVDRNNLYNHNQLLDLYGESESNICFIDPINGLDHKIKFGSTEMTYKFSNDVRQFCNHTNKTIFVNAHTVTEASRRIYPNGHDLQGYQMPPIKSMIEGGQPFASRADDFWIINRLVNHSFLKNYTQLEIQKVKDTETGGTTTLKDEPLCFEYGGGLGFKYSPIKITQPETYNSGKTDLLEGLRMDTKPKEQPQSAITPNLDFDSPMTGTAKAGELELTALDIARFEAEEKENFPF